MVASQMASQLRAAAVRSAVAQNRTMAPRYTRQASHAVEAEHGHAEESPEGGPEFDSSRDKRNMDRH